MPGPLDNAPLTGGKYSSWRCKMCVAAFRVDRVYRDCGFHPRTMTFRANNRSCATLSKLRWILQHQGVPLMHEELSGAVAAYSLGLPDGERILGTWLRGRTRTLLMAAFDGVDCVSLSLATAEKVLREYGGTLTDDDEELSAGWTR